MATAWKKIIVSGSVAELDRVIASSVTGSFKGDGSGLTGVASTLGVAGNTGTGTVNLTSQTLSIKGTTNEVETAVSNQTVTIGLPNSVSLTKSITAPTGSFGNLVVTGETTVINTTNLTVEDRFILLASGSTSSDAGIIVPTSVVSGVQFGRAFFYDSTDDRWSFNDAVAENNTGAALPQAWAGVVYTGAINQAPGAAPRYGGTSTGHGSIFVDTVTGDIYIYTKDGDAVDNGNVADFGGQQVVGA